MQEIKDEHIIIGSTLIALEHKSSLKIEQLSDYVYDIARNIGMKKFSKDGVSHILIPHVVPVLKKAELVHFGEKNPWGQQIDPDNVGPATICTLTEKTRKNLEKIRKGKRVKSNNSTQQEIFRVVNILINGHLDEKGTFEGQVKARTYQESLATEMTK